MEVQELAEGLWRWTGWHEEWKQKVGSVYCQVPDAVVLIDPLVPPEDSERFWRALDRDVKRHGGAVHVLITIFWHTRGARDVIARYGARLWASSRGRTAVARRAGEVTDPFRPGDPLPGGIEAYASGRGTEIVYWLPKHRAVVPGDVILGADGGGLRLCPESWLPEGVGHQKVRQVMQPLLELPVEQVLVSHGEPVLEGARRALAQVLSPSAA
jgi:glyoxylase-like metal-dependent hydrolase (beta-lactamase superfamily II)